MSKNLCKLISTLFVAGFSMIANAEAPSTVRLVQVQGDVMVNDGVKYQKASSGNQVKMGSKLVTAKNATVNMVYENGCVKTVKANTIITVGSQNECTTAIFKNEKTYVAAAAGDTVLQGTKQKGFWQQMASGKWVFIGLGGAALAYGISSTNSDSTDSIVVVSPAAPPV
jgi:hypothetical protein